MTTTSPADKQAHASYQTPVQQTPPPDTPNQDVGGWSARWAHEFASVLWQLDVPVQLVPGELAKIQAADLDDAQLAQLLLMLRQQATTCTSTPWQQGESVQPPGMPPTTDGPPSQEPPTSGPPGGTQPPATTPAPTPTPTPTPTPDPDGDGGGGSIKPWLIGAGVLAGGAAAALAIRTGIRNVRALGATAAAFRSGAIGQGGLHALHDAQLGARFARGIGALEYTSVALPGVNRFGLGGRLTSVARGHVDHLDMVASATALQRTVGDGVAIHAPTREAVSRSLRSGSSLDSILGDLDRSAAGARPVFDDAQLLRYQQQGSVVEAGRGWRQPQVVSATTVTRPSLAIGPGGIVASEGTTRINQLVARRGANFGSGEGLAASLGSTQGLNVSTLRPGMQQGAIAASGVDPALVDSIGLPGAFTQRWRDRLAAGAHPAAPPGG